MTETVFHNEWVNDIPVRWIAPVETHPSPRLLIWLTGLSGTKEGEDARLAQLVARGYYALSFDPYQHGERGTETPKQIIERVFGNFRNEMWPILAHTTEDTPRVIDWALDRFSLEPPVLMGGISMGGDIAVAAAGIDPRITVVAACCATPDWMRPGMNIPAG
ncbi:MAG: hypothetical protein JW750_01360, partial [Anaerolineaceae bacterium]|nr:hypothetical protein [Anaerolineaceae bacterium]